MEKEKALNEVSEARNKLKLAELDLQLGKNSINCLEKIEVYTQTKPVPVNSFPVASPQIQNHQFYH